MNMVHVEDVATGVLLALDKGEIGESYVLGGDITTMRGVMDTTAKVMGKREPRGNIPTGRPEGRRARRPRDRQDHGPAAEHARAHLIVRRRHLLGVLGQGRGEARLRARPLDRGLRETLEAEGKL